MMVKNRVFIFLLIGILSIVNLGSTLHPDQPTPPPTYDPLSLAKISDQIQNGEIHPNEVVVRLQPNTDLESVSKCAGISASNNPRNNPKSANFAQVIQFIEGSLIEILPKIQNCPGVLYAEPNFLVYALETIPDDTSFSRQYGLLNIHAPQGWDRSTGSNSVVVAILDSGVDLSHPDLSGKLVAGYDFVNQDSIAQDDFGHGTHVAGIAAAVTNNDYGIAGVSWGARIMPIKVLNSSGNGYTSDSAQGIIWATDHGAKVINMSFGSSSPSSVMLDAINYAFSKGVVLIAASGNDGINGVLYPAKYNHVISIGATDSNNIRANFSNYGSELDFVAPGVNIYSTLIADEFGFKSGTSMATPFASGLAALLFGLPTELTPEKVEQAMVNSALDLGSSGKDIFYGNGLIQVDGAILELLPPSPFTKTNPVNSKTDESTEIIFSWDNSTFADSYEFCVDTSNDNSCTDIWNSTNQTISNDVNLQSDTKYYWQVRAVNSNGLTYADNNSWWSFTTIRCSTLTTIIDPIGGGSVLLEPAPDCQNGTKYSEGTQVNLSAIPVSNKYRFLNWGGYLSGPETSKTIGMNTDHSIIANFEKATFDDVPFDFTQSLGGVTFYLHPYIQALWDNGYTNGIWIEKDNDGNPIYALYGPENFLNRGMVAKFLLNVVHGREYVVPTLPFSPQFNLDNWSDPDINWAWPWAEELLVEGLTNGCYQDPDTLERAYCPTNISSRAEAAKFGLTLKYGSLYLPPDASGTVFADMLLPELETDPPAHWGIAWAEEAYLEGLLPNCGIDTVSGKPLYCPDDPVNRAWSAYLIVKAKNLILP